MTIIERIPTILPIRTQPWAEQFPSEVMGSVQISFTKELLELEYSVDHNEFLGRHKGYMDPVYTDSCAEVFLTIDNIHYYNLEFGLLGGRLCSCKKIETGESLPISQEQGERITVESKIYKESELIAQLYPSKGETYSVENPFNAKGEYLRWSLNVSIPIEFFEQPKIESFSGLALKANFYLCGDDLEKPYYLSWAPLPEEGEPNFHQPEHFKPLNLE